MVIWKVFFFIIKTIMMISLNIKTKQIRGEKKSNITAYILLEKKIAKLTI